MTINTKFKTELNQARVLRKLRQPIPTMDSQKTLIVETKRLTNKLHSIIMKTDQYYGLNWLVGFEQYIELKRGNLLNKTYVPTKRHYSRGHIVSIELFGHFNKELTFIHPAIVLYDSNGTNMLVAPISSTKFNDINALHIDITTSDGMKNNCAICLDQIRFIDKSRVVFQWTNQTSSNIKISSTILDRIDEALLTNYLPSSDAQINQLNLDLKEAREENKKLSDQITDLKQRLSAV